MNRLINRNPKTVEIDGIEYILNTDFRNCLLIIMAFEDNSLTSWEKQDILLGNLYCEENGKFPETLKNIEKAYELGIKFLDGGEEIKNTKPQERLYSFEQDSKYITSALLNKANGIDLDSIDNMHFWTFISHFMEMGESTFSSIVHLRRQNSKGKLTKEEKLQCEQIGWDIINLKQEEIEIDKDNVFEQYLNG